MQLQNKCVLITGAASGLGRATAQLLHDAGANIVLVDLRQGPLREFASALEERAIAAAADVREPEQVAAAIERGINQFGPLHAVVNCAGVASSAKIVSGGEAHTIELWRKVIDVNLTGTFNVLRLAVSHMIRNTPDEDTGERGVVVNTASIAAFEGQRGQAAYAASKAAVAALSLPVARDLVDHAIRCVAIAPGLFETAIFEQIPDKGVEALKRGLLFPPRMGEPKEFASLVRHIIENPYLNGACLRLDGGVRLPA